MHGILSFREKNKTVHDKSCVVSEILIDTKTYILTSEIYFFTHISSLNPTYRLKVWNHDYVHRAFKNQMNDLPFLVGFIFSTYGISYANGTSSFFIVENLYFFQMIHLTLFRDERERLYVFMPVIWIIGRPTWFCL